MKVYLNRNEILQLKNYLDNNPKVFDFVVIQSHESALGNTTIVEPADASVMFADITDYDAW